jgi:hypothetical protein
MKALSLLAASVCLYPFSANAVLYGGTNGYLFTIDISTGAQTLIGQDPSFRTTEGLAFSPVPLPPALYLFGTGLLGLVGMARRTRA